MTENNAKAALESDMVQEVAIHRADLAHGIPAPKPFAAIENPCATSNITSAKHSIAASRCSGPPIPQGRSTTPAPQSRQ